MTLRVLEDLLIIPNLCQKLSLSSGKVFLNWISVGLPVSAASIISHRYSHNLSSFNLDGNEVDPECGLSENAHVFSCRLNQRDIKYFVILGHVDILNNRNSYFRMQLLESNEIKLWVKHWAHPRLHFEDKLLDFLLFFILKILGIWILGPHIDSDWIKTPYKLWDIRRSS